MVLKLGAASGRIYALKLFAEWYLTLCYLKDDDIEQARQLLKTINSSSGHPQQSQAARLLEELK